MPEPQQGFVCPYADEGATRCPEWRCDCFVDVYPDDPFGLHPEAYVVGGLPPDPLDGIEVVHLRLPDGRCVLSLNGQGHLPCAAHLPEPPERA